MVSRGLVSSGAVFAAFVSFANDRDIPDHLRGSPCTTAGKGRAGDTESRVDETDGHEPGGDVVEDTRADCFSLEDLAADGGEGEAGSSGCRAVSA